MGALDSYSWIGSTGGSWNSASDWKDTTTGANPATSAPGANNAVTIPGPTGAIYEVIAGGGNAASLNVTGFVDLVGAYGAGALSVGSVTGAPNSASFTAGGLTLGAGSTLTSTTANVVDGTLTVSGAGAALTASGAVTVGSPGGYDVTVAGQTYSNSGSASGTLNVSAGATLSAASLTVADGSLSASGSGSSVTLTGGLTLGTAAAGTYAYPQTSPYYYGNNGSLSVASGASVTVDGAVTLSASESNASVSGAGSKLVATGVLTAPASLSVTGGGSVQVGGLVVPAAATSGSAGLQTLTIAVDATSTLEIGATGGAAVGTLTLDAGQSVTLAAAETLTGAVVVNGVLSESAGLLIGSGSFPTVYGVTSSLGGTGTVDLGANTTLTLQGTAAAGLTLDYTGANATLEIGATSVYNYTTGTSTYTPDAVGATLADMASGDGIILDNVALTSAVYNYSGADKGTLKLYAGTSLFETLTLAGDYTGRTFFISPTTSGGSAVLLLSNAGPGSSPVATNSDAFTWIGSTGGSWNSASDWKDTTTGANPATSAPGANNAVTIPGPTGAIYEVIAGGGNAASLNVTGFVDLVGAYGAGALSVGSVTGAPNSASFTAGGLTLGAGSTLTSTTANVVDGTLTVSGAGAALTASGAVTVGSPGGYDVTVAGQTYSNSGSASGTLNVSAGATLSAASLTVADGSLSASGSGSSVTLTGGLTLGTAAAGTYAYPQTSPYYYGNYGSLSVASGASVTVGGAVTLSASYSTEVQVNGAGSKLVATGVLTAPASLSVTGSGSVQVGGLVVPVAATSGSAGMQTLTIAVDATSTFEIGATGGAAVGTLTLDAGESVTLAAAETLTGATIVNGVLAENAGLLIGTGSFAPIYGVTSSLGGTGTVDLGANTTLTLKGTAAAGLTLDYTGANATLEIGGTSVYDYTTGTSTYTPYAVGATLADMASGDGIIVDNVALTSAVYNYSGADRGTLKLYAGTSLAETLTLAGDYTGRTFFISPTTSGGSAVALLARPGTTIPGGQSVLAGVATPLAGVSISDSNAQASGVTVTLSDAKGALSATAAGGLVLGSGSTTLKLSGTVAQVNAALASLSYLGSTPGDDIVDVSAVDALGSVSVAAAVPVTVLALAPPVVNVPTVPAVGTVSAPGVFTDVSITYPDGAVAGEQVTVTLSDTSGLLSVDPTTPGGGGTITGSGTTKVTISGTLSQVNDDLATLGYAASGTGTELVTVSATGTHGGAGLAQSFVIVTAGAPSITAPSAVAVGLDQATPIGPIVLAESSAAADETFTVVVFDGAGELSATGDDVFGSGTTSLTIVGDLASVNSALATLTDTGVIGGDDVIAIDARDSLGQTATLSTIAVEVDNFAQATIPATPVEFGAVHIGATPTTTLSLSNIAAAPAQALDATLTSSDPQVTASGTVTGLVAGATDSTSLKIGLLAKTPGLIDAQLTLELDSAGTPLPSQSVEVQGAVYAVASASVAATQTFVFHVADAGAADVAISNVAPAGAYSENLVVTETGLSGGFSLAGATSETVAAGQTGNALQLLVPTTTSGSVTGTLTLSLVSDGTGVDGLGQTDLGTKTLSIKAAVDNYAALSLSASGGKLTRSGANLTLDLGTLTQGAFAPTVLLTAANSATGLADLLSGSVSKTSGQGVLVSGGAFGGLGAGQSATAAGFTLDTSQTGEVSETFVIDANGSNASGYSGALTPETLTVTGIVKPTPAPDLTVSSISAPTTAISGQPVQVSWTTANIGDAAAAGPWTDNIYVASDAQGDNLQLVGTYSYNGSLAAGESLTASALVTLPSNVTGNAYFVVQADPSGVTGPHPNENHQGIATSPTAVTTVVDWASQEASLRPPSIDAQDWSLIWSRFTTYLGSTTQRIEAALGLVNQQLVLLGDPAPTNAQLIAFALAQASGVSPNMTLAATTDLADSGTGLDLSLTRTYSASFLNRNNAGAFGDGWTFTYGVKATTDGAGDVYVSSSTGTEFFAANADGSYSAQAGDTAKLAKVNGAFVLTGVYGNVEKFLANGDLASIADANGNVATVSYDANGFISAVTSSNGQSLAFTTNSAGRIVKAVDGTGATVTYTYDASDDHLLSATGPQGTTTYSYSSSGDLYVANALTGITQPDGTQQSFAYDTQGNLIAETDAGATTKYSYPAIGTLTETDAAGDKTTLSYDSSGNLVKAVDATGQGSTLTYDGNGDLLSVVTPLGEKSTFSYDGLGNLTSYVDPDGGKVTATYQAGTKLLTSLTDQNGNTTDYAYDSAGDLTKITYDNGAAQSYAYASTGAPTSATDANGHTTTYSYNAQGLLAGESFADGTTQAYGYNSLGELTSATATNGQTTKYTYNAAGELTSVTNAAGQVESYAWNALGQETSRTEPDGSVTNYSYNANGQLAKLTDGTGALITSYSYNSLGELTGALDGNGQTTAYQYDANGDVTQILVKDATGKTTSELDYSYDADGRPVSVKSLDGTWTYGYDANGQLTHAVFASTNASIASQDLTYVYDAAGNRVKTIYNGAEDDYTTNGLNQYTAVDGTTYGYDLNGNLVSETKAGATTSYVYNDQNQLVSVSGPRGTTSYSYDALGNVVSTTDDGVTTNYVIDPLAISTAATGPLPAIAQAYDAQGKVQATYEYGDGLAANSSPSLGMLYFNLDSLENVVSVTGFSGQQISTYNYDPFGNTSAEFEQLTNGNLTFEGGLGVSYAVTDLYNMRARY